MSYLLTLTLIAGLYLVAVASPGPNFFIISQLALNGRQREGRLVAVERRCKRPTHVPAVQSRLFAVAHLSHLVCAGHSQVRPGRLFDRTRHGTADQEALVEARTARRSV